MDTYSRYTVCDAPGDRGGRSEDAAFGDRLGGDRSDKRFAARSNNNWTGQLLDEAASALQQLKIVFQRLAKPDAGVEQDLRTLDARLDRGLTAIVKKRDDLGDDIGVMRIPLHRRRGA